MATGDLGVEQVTTKIRGDQWLQNYIPYLLYRATNKLNSRLLTRLRAMKINPSQWRVLSVLRAYGTLSVSAIVESTLMEQPTVSRVVAQLEQEGRVVRSPAEADSRVTEVSLTPAGLEAFNAIVPAALRHQEMALQGLSKKEIATLMDILKKIEANIELYA